MNLHNIMQSEKSHTEKEKYHVIALIYVEYKKNKKMNKENKTVIDRTNTVHSC